MGVEVPNDVNNHIPNCAIPSGFSSNNQLIMKWIFYTFLLPIVVPYALINLIRRYRWSKKKTFTLKGKVVLITGASSGLGEALAREFYSAGCRVILASRRREELERVKNDLLKLSLSDPICPPVIIPLDLEDLTQLPTKAKEILKVYDHVDVLVNNGGISYRGEAVNTSVDVDIKLMVINYFGQVALTKALLPSMIERKEGHIISISSVQGKIALPFRSAYSASKHALQAFSDSLRSEVHQHNVRVTVISPGYIRTNLSVNAVTGTGSKYGIFDSTSSNGYEPALVARSIIKSVVLEDNDSVVSSIGPRLAIMIRSVCPPLYFHIMQLRARKTSANKQDVKDKEQ